MLLVRLILIEGRKDGRREGRKGRKDGRKKEGGKKEKREGRKNYTKTGKEIYTPDRYRTQTFSYLDSVVEMSFIEGAFVDFRF